jgi:hypothetical protein
LRDQQINNLIKKVPLKYFNEDEEKEDEDKDESKPSEEVVHQMKSSIQVNVSMPRVDEQSLS